MMRYVIFIVLLLTACTPQATSTLAPLPTFAPSADDVQFLQYWQTETGILTGEGQFDEWYFSGDAGDGIFIRAINRQATVRLTLYQGTTIIVEADNVLELTLPASVTYHVRVDWVSGAGEYDIGLGYTDRENPNDIAPTAIPQVVGVPTPTPSFAELGNFIRRIEGAGDYSGTLIAEALRNIYTLNGEGGMIVNFELYGLSGELDPVLRLFDADGNIVAMDDNSLGDGDARLLNITLPEDGLYSVQVDGQGATGNYTLVYQAMPIALVPDIVPITEASPTPQPYTTPMIAFAVPDQRLDDHLPAINSLTRVGDFQRFSFYADAGERISIVLEPLPGSGLLPQFEVYNPNGELVVSAQSSTSNAEGAATANGLIIGETGAHIIIVTSESSTTGQFVISFGRGSSVRDEFQGFAFSNASTTGTITRVGTRHIWQLDLNPGDVITVAASPNDTLLDPVIELVTADGTRLAQDDDGGSSDRAAFLRRVEITTPATYLLRIYDESGTHTGDYTLLWNLISTAPTPTPIPALTTILAVDDTVADGAYEFFAFQGQAGQQIQVEVVGIGETVLDPVLAILDPTGAILLEVDDSEGSLNPMATLTLPISGTYQVRVNGYLSSGDFSVTVAILLD